VRWDESKTLFCIVTAVSDGFIQAWDRDS
jgi:hypothetical protein